MSSDKHHDEHSDGIRESGKKIPGYFYLLFYGLIIWGVIFMAYYLFSGWSSSQEFTEKMAAHTGTTTKSEIPAATPAPAATERPVAAPVPAAAAPATSGTINAAELYASNCAGCHGAAGTGGFGTDLTSASYEYGKDATSVKASIATGRSGKMPAFEGRLSSGEIDALVDFVLQF